MIKEKIANTEKELVSPGHLMNFKHVWCPKRERVANGWFVDYFLKFRLDLGLVDVVFIRLMKFLLD